MDQIPSSHQQGPLYSATLMTSLPLRVLHEDAEESETDDYVLISMTSQPSANGVQDTSPKYLSEIDGYIDRLQDTLWPLNKYMHDEPEIAFKERKAHDALTTFMRSKKGWAVFPHAFGLETSWEAVFDTGRDGPAISFNAEMGMWDGPSPQLIFR